MASAFLKKRVKQICIFPSSAFEHSLPFMYAITYVACFRVAGTAGAVHSTANSKWAARQEKLLQCHFLEQTTQSLARFERTTVRSLPELNE